jgi:hypothetical protein
VSVVEAADAVEPIDDAVFPVVLAVDVEPVAPVLETIVGDVKLEL